MNFATTTLITSTISAARTGGGKEPNDEPSKFGWVMIALCVIGIVTIICLIK